MLDQQLDDYDDVCVLNNTSGKRTVRAAQLEELMVPKDMKARDFERCHPNGLRSPFSAPLSKRSRVSNARTARANVHNSKQKPVLDYALIFAMLKHTLRADSAELSRHRVERSHQPSTVLVSFC